MGMLFVFIPRVSLRLPWAEEAIGLSARLGCQGYALPLTFQPAWSIPLFVRAMRHGNNASVQIGGICGSKNQALNALEKASGRTRPQIAQIDTDFFACGEPFYEGAF